MGIIGVSFANDKLVTQLSRKSFLLGFHPLNGLRININGNNCGSFVGNTPAKVSCACTQIGNYFSFYISQLINDQIRLLPDHTVFSFILPGFRFKFFSHSGGIGCIDYLITVILSLPFTGKKCGKHHPRKKNS
jgi:hypothetical protein